MEEFPSGQRGQTVNLLRLASVVRIHPPPPNKVDSFDTTGIETVNLFLFAKMPVLPGFSMLLLFG